MLKKISVALVLLFACIGFAFSAVFIGMQFGVFNVRGAINERNQFFTGVPRTNTCVNTAEQTCDWKETSEWETVKGGLLKDAEIIKKVSRETGISERMIATVVIPEQVRFFTSEREVFKSYFEPLKILGSLSQFSLGVSGIKQETANEIEKYTTDTESEFYAGKGMSSLIKYPDNVDRNAELYNRLTDPKDHYYSYLYTALYIKEIGNQWEKAGFDISHSPGIVATLFNIGFQASEPKPNPVVAGALISVGGKKYLFGELGASFYHSNELTDVFPK
ncbi:DUF1402 family protein [Patescibacteria group bacterium]|nr:MAG: DUF1402 family protein [Patescibacteria group bacterium]